MRFEKVSFEQYSKDYGEDILYKVANPYSYREISISSEMKEHPIYGFDDTQLDAKTIYDDLQLPKRATKKSAGYDFYAPYSFSLNPGDTIKIASGIRVILDDDKYLMCAPRSGHGFKARIQLDNTIGIIDADYSDSDNEGHIMIKLTNDGHFGKTIQVKKGDGLMQAIISKYYTVEDDISTETRNGGFGSTDNK